MSLDNESIYIVHEYGAPSHYLALTQGTIMREGHGVINFIEFSPLKSIIKSLRYRDLKLLRKNVYNIFVLLFFFIFPSLLKNKVVILGCAPFDPKLLLLRRILKYSKVTYHTSWPTWDGSFYPKMNRFMGSSIEKVWFKFISYEVHNFAVVTEKIKGQLVQHYGVPEHNIQVVYHSFSQSIFFPPRKPVDKINSRLSVVFAARFVPEKGINIIMELAQIVENVDFVLVGGGPLLDTVKNTSLKNVTVLGEISSRERLADIFREADVILQPSIKNDIWEELFGMALIEAMACGTVPICSNHTGPNSILSTTKLKKNLVAEGRDMLDDFKTILDSYSSNRESLFLDKEESIEIAKKFNVESICLRWKLLLN